MTMYASWDDNVCKSGVSIYLVVLRTDGVNEGLFVYLCDNEAAEWTITIRRDNEKHKYQKASEEAETIINSNQHE